MLETLLISIHPGAEAWLRLQGIQPDRVLLAQQMNPRHNPFSPEFRSGSSWKAVIGSVPVHMASRYRPYLDIVMDLPADYLGRPLSLPEMLQFNARLGEYRVLPILEPIEIRFSLMEGEALRRHNEALQEKARIRLENRIPCTLITQHPGAAQWFEDYNPSFPSDGWLDLDRVYDRIPPDFPDMIREGEMVVGTLPVHLAAWVCHRKARYADLMLEVPPKAVGRRFDRRYLERTCCYLEEFEVNWILPAEEPLFTGAG